jgi:predicted 3-demethylubiquinone-9 3-methyltransferase (glyoxalase superfamily)
MQIKQKITPCLWFDDQAEDAAEFYTGIFPNSKIVKVTRYSDAGREIHHRPLDRYWEKLSKGGDEKAQQCGWLRDKYGLSWQVVPTLISELFSDHASEKTRRAMNAMLRMKKLDIAELKRAYEG